MKPPGGVRLKAGSLKPSVIALGTALLLRPSNATDVLLEHPKLAKRSQQEDQKSLVALKTLTHLTQPPTVARTTYPKMAALKAAGLKMAVQEAAVQKEADLTIAILEAIALGIVVPNVILPLNPHAKTSSHKHHQLQISLTAM
jgi:hypothetical protein